MRYCTMVIQNFKSFLGKHEFLLDRKPGLYHLAGRNKMTGDSNGAGKTTICDALTWVRFGKTGRDNRPGASIRPWKLAHPSDTTYVDLIFEGIDGKTRELYRSRRPNKLKMGYIDDELYDVTQEDVDKVFGDSEEMFRRAIVMAQQEVSFLDMRPEQQSQMFTDALNLEVWLRAATLAGKKHKKALEEIEDLRVRKSMVIGKIKAIKEFLVDERKLAKGFKASQLVKRAELTKHLELNFLEMQTKVNTLPGWGSKAGVALLGKATRGRQPGAESPKPGGLATPLATPLAQGAVAPALAALLKRLTGMDRQLKATQECLREYELKQQSIKTRLVSLEEEQIKYEEAIHLNPVCPECGQKVSTLHLTRKLDKVVSTIAKLRHNKGVVSRRIKHVSDEALELQKQFGHYDLLAGNLKDLIKDIEEVQEKIKRLDQEANPHKNRILTHIISLEQYRSNKRELTNKIETCEKQAEEYDYWGEAFKTIRLELIDTTLTELEMACVQHIDALGLEEGWELKFQTERETKSGSVPKFSALLYPPDRKEPAKWENYSGGENQRWRFAVALGLSDIILAHIGVQPNIEFYDEPTRGMSSEGIELFLEHLRERALEIGKAIFVVEHHSLERGLFDGVITVVKNKNGSRILKEKGTRV